MEDEVIVHTEILSDNWKVKTKSLENKLKILHVK